jgi:hypothetical protein
VKQQPEFMTFYGQWWQQVVFIVHPLIIFIYRQYQIIDFALVFFFFQGATTLHLVSKLCPTSFFFHSLTFSRPDRLSLCVEGREKIVSSVECDRDSLPRLFMVIQSKQLSFSFS